MKKYYASYLYFIDGGKAQFIGKIYVQPSKEGYKEIYTDKVIEEMLGIPLYIDSSEKRLFMMRTIDEPTYQEVKNYINNFDFDKLISMMDYCQKITSENDKELKNIIKEKKNLLEEI